MSDGQLLSDRFFRPVVTVLTLAYIAGAIGLHVSALAPLFVPLIPFNLLGSLLLLLLFHTDWRTSFFFYCGLAFTIGFLIEVLGVHTGYIFGTYAYGPTLGRHLWNVPLVIGANWVMLTYCCGVVCNRLPVPIYLKTAIAASLMVLLDLFIESVAVRLDFWTWFGADIPIRNYLGWWIVSLIILSIWYGLPFRKENRLAGPLLLLQFLFFAAGDAVIFLAGR